MSQPIKIYPCKYTGGTNGKSPVVDVEFLWIPNAMESVVLIDQNCGIWRVFRTWKEAQHIYPEANMAVPLVVKMPDHGISCEVGFCVLAFTPTDDGNSQKLDPLFPVFKPVPIPSLPYWKEVGLSKMSRVVMYFDARVLIPSKSETMVLVKHLSELKSTTLEIDSVQSSLLEHLDKFVWNNGEISLAECPLSKGLLWILEKGEPVKGAQLKGSTYLIASTLASAPFEQSTTVVFGTDPDGDALLTVYSMPDLGIFIESSVALHGIQQKATAGESSSGEDGTKLTPKKLKQLLTQKAGVVPAGKVSKFQEGTSKLDV